MNVKEIRKLSMGKPKKYNNNFNWGKIFYYTCVGIFMCVCGVVIFLT